MRASLSAVALLCLPLAACATLADAAPGDEDLPNAGAGPFRELRRGELGLLLVAPNAVNDDKRFTRDASVIDADGDPATLPVIGYFAANASGAAPDDPPVEIRRDVALDGRSFVRESTVVLEPTEDWEQGTIGAPSALGVGSEVWLFYEAGGGIGLAKSSDSLSFVKESGPVLAPATSGWDAKRMPRNPSVVALPNGELAMFYEAVATGGLGLVEPTIGEARSTDGVTWTRVGDGPVLAPGAPGEEAYDDAAVGAPCAVTGETALGRPLVWLYYAAESGAGKRTIGLAGRFEDGPFERAASPVLGAGTSRQPRAPSVIVFDELTLLFATQHASSNDEDPAVAVGVAPAQATLPPPSEED